MQYSFYFDQSRCTGCYTCLIACKDWHEYDIGSEPSNWIKVTTMEKGRFPDLSVSFLFITCLHCAHPSCIPACPVGAIKKREEDGIVVIDRGMCLGIENCEGFCQTACPYKTPEFGFEPDAKMQKCDFCLDRWAQGKMPICIEGCPMRALDAGPIEGLRAKYGDIRMVEGFAYSEKVEPSIVFKLKRQGGGV
jgi:anaerobic dimethyl sulfoxide reductase subunit B (iron-sulfur subunit)